MSRTLLIDADLIAYRCTAALQSTIDWEGDGSCVSVNGRLEEAKQAARQEIDKAMDELKGTDLIVCMSDEVVNFRRTMVDETYKTHRTGERPVHLYDLKEWLAAEYESCMMPRLEADDVMGILATEPHHGERVMVSLDKDMKTVPALLCTPPHWTDKNPKWAIQEITPEAADRFHLWQTLCGDTVDGYPGCPGCGPAAADNILDHQLAWRAQHREITRGKRKGETETKWVYETTDDCAWLRVLSAYHKAGLAEADALKQARLAYILRHGSLDGNRIRLWEPQLT